MGDVTLRSPVTANGAARPGAAHIEGSTFAGARRDKAEQYPELVAASDRFAFLVLAAEVGGRFAPEAADLVRQLVSAAADRAPPPLKRTYRLIYHRRWWGILSMAVQRAISMNLLGEDGRMVPICGEPSLEVLLSMVEAPLVSRLG